MCFWGAYFRNSLITCLLDGQDMGAVKTWAVSYIFDEVAHLFITHSYLMWFLLDAKLIVIKK